MEEDHLYAALIASRGESDAITIVDFMRRADVTSGCYAFKFRVKSKDNLLAKRERKLSNKPAYALTDITDVIGIRLVTLFKGDMLAVYENLIGMLSKPRQGSAFLHSVPEEIIVYKGSSVIEDFTNEIRSITKTYFPHAEVMTEQSVAGYSSIHIICRHAGTISEIEVDGKPYRLPVEIQIRTVFEDAWGEIDHKYGYTFREGKEAGTPLANSHHIKAHLRVLKDFTDACMDYAECIRKEAHPEFAEITTGAAKTISVESDNEVLARFSELKLPAEFIERYVEARKIRDEASKKSGATHDGRITAVQTYLQAAELFSCLSKELSPEDTASGLKEDGPRLAYYYCAMNEAFCLMSTNSPDYLSIAVDKYQFIVANFSHFPLAKMRLGQALGKIGQLDESIEALEDAGELFQKLHRKNAATGTWSDQLPKADHEHMLYTLPKILGFTLWKKTQQHGISEEEKAYLYINAYVVTDECLHSEGISQKQRLDILNNLLYYCVSYVRCIAAKPDKRAELQSQLPKLLDSLVTESGGLDKLTIEELDTVFRTYAYVGNAQATQAATALRQRCLSKDANLDSKICFSLAAVAQEFLNSGTVPDM